MNGQLEELKELQLKELELKKLKKLKLKKLQELELEKIELEVDESINATNNYTPQQQLNNLNNFNNLNNLNNLKQLDNAIAMRLTLSNCMESLFAVGVTEKTPDEAYYDILNQLKAYYQADITFFHKFKEQTNATNQITNFYEVYADGIKETEYSLPITVSDTQMLVLEKLALMQSSDYKAHFDLFNNAELDVLQKFADNYQLKSICSVAVKNKAGDIIAIMGVTNPHQNENDKELLTLLSRFICMFIEHEQDTAIKNEARKLEESSKQNLVEKCIINSQNLTHANESVSNMLDALCLHYDADFSVALLDQDDGYCVSSYIGGEKVPNLDGINNQPRHIMAQRIQVFSKYPEVVTNSDLVDPVSTMVKNLLKDRYGIQNFIVSPLKDREQTIKGLLFLNNFKLLNRGHSMVHFVAESVSSYLSKIGLYENTQLGLLSRLANKNTLQSQITQLLDEGKNGTLFIINIDDFKQLNDTFGHHMGDQAIVDLAENLKKLFKSTDIIGRIGGDEFVVFSYNVVSLDDVIAMAKQILTKCFHKYEKDGVSLEISTSIGIAMTNDKCRKFQPLKENADYSLYTAKKNGKHRFHIYSDSEYSADNSVIDEMQFYPNVVEKLQSALQNHRFVVFYQPIYHVPTGTFTQAEALVRIAKPDGSLIYPNDFIEVAETSGLVVEMTYQILEQICSDFRTILNQNPNTSLKSIALNVPYLQFTDPEMEYRFLEILKKYDIAPQQIKLEITERTVITDMELMLSRMKSLKSVGFEFELDDFGTNYSNLKMCVSLPLEIIKLDRSLLLAAMGSEQDCRFFQHILLALHDSNRHTVMEGVETEEQLEWTIGCNCDYVQGYYFSKPVDFKDFCDVLIGDIIKPVPQTDIQKDDKFNEKMKAYILNYDHFPCGVAVINRDEKFTVACANPSFYKIIGHTQEEFLKNHGNRLTDILIDYFKDESKKHDLTKDFDFEWDLRVRTSDGSIRWVHDVCHYDAEMGVFFTVYVDITNKMGATTDLSHTAFQTKNEILLYLSKYISKYFIVTDLQTDEVIFMSSSAMKKSGFKSESDWQGKTQIELGFGCKENVHDSYYKPLSEDKFTVYEYYNVFHKKYIKTESKIINIPSLGRKMKFTIINDITAQRKLERNLEAQTTLHHCIEALFTADTASTRTTSTDSTVNKHSHLAYEDVLGKIKAYYQADRAFLYKFKAGTYEVESFYDVCDKNLSKIDMPFPMVASKEHIKQMHGFSKSKLVTAKQVLDALEPIHKTKLLQAYIEYKINTFACVSITNKNGDVIAFMGVTNPQSYQDTKTVMDMLSRYMCMYIEHEQDNALNEQNLELESISKKKLIAQSAKNFLTVSNANENITRTLDALCQHYMADFAVILSLGKDNFGVTHVSNGDIPDLSGLQEASHFMGSWLGTFKQHEQFASDLDFDDAGSPIIKKMLSDKFGINNFVASPMRDNHGDLTGMLIVNNLHLTNRSHLMVHVVAKDISDYLDRAKMQETIQLEPSTQLSNKVSTKKQISKSLESGNKGALFIIDIDNFKELNDTLGHQVGDEAIVDIAQILKTMSRSTDIIGRIGGDEFMLFCENLSQQDYVITKANQLLKKCHLTYSNTNFSVQISASIGICCVDDQNKTYDDLYTKADLALYKSKQDGKNRFTIH